MFLVPREDNRQYIPLRSTLEEEVDRARLRRAEEAVDTDSHAATSSSRSSTKSAPGPVTPEIILTKYKARAAIAVFVQTASEILNGDSDGLIGCNILMEALSHSLEASSLHSLNTDDAAVRARSRNLCDHGCTIRGCNNLCGHEAYHDHGKPEHHTCQEHIEQGLAETVPTATDPTS